MVERSVLQSKIAFVQTRLRELRLRQKVTVEQFRKELSVQAIIFHHFQVVIQACCDTASHIIASEELGIPGSAPELFEILAQEKIIPRSLAERFGDHVRLRNRIVHGYNKLDYADIHATLPNRFKDVTRFLKAVASYAKL